MSSLLCGIDAGGTSCRAVVLSLDGTRSGWGYSTGANPTHAGWSGTDSAMQEAVRRACENAGTDNSEIESIYLGMAGVVTEMDREHVIGLCRNWELSSKCRYGVDHDIRIALWGGLSGRSGVALIAGTGSSCYGRNSQGESWQSGGWDRILDDLGSGYDLAQKGMTAACQSADGRLGATLLKDYLFEALRVTCVADFSLKVHRPGLARHEVAALAPLVLKAANQKDLVAIKVVCKAANELARMVSGVTERLFPKMDPEIVMVGGLIEKPGDYRGYVEQAIRQRLPQSSFTMPELRPAIGAVALAAEQIGQTIPPHLLQQVSSQAKA